MIQVLEMQFLFEDIDGIWVKGYSNDRIDHEIFPENLILMQYIGLKDKNGVEIFEGDIVEAFIYSDEKPQVLTVEYRDTSFVIDYEDSESECVPVGLFVGSLKVIGNIHENPERLEAS